MLQAWATQMIKNMNGTLIYSKLSTQLRRDVSDAARRAKQVVEDRQKANTQARKAVGVFEAHRKAI